MKIIYKKITNEQVESAKVEHLSQIKYICEVNDAKIVVPYIFGGLKEIKNILNKMYPHSKYNIYVAIETIEN